MAISLTPPATGEKPVNLAPLAIDNSPRFVSGVESNLPNGLGEKHLILIDSKDHTQTKWIAYQVIKEDGKDSKVLYTINGQAPNKDGGNAVYAVNENGAWTLPKDFTPYSKTPRSTPHNFDIFLTVQGGEQLTAARNSAGQVADAVGSGAIAKSANTEFSVGVHAAWYYKIIGVGGGIEYKRIGGRLGNTNTSIDVVDINLLEIGIHPAGNLNRTWRHGVGYMGPFVSARLYYSAASGNGGFADVSDAHIYNSKKG
jgi:hypothetical protein